MVDIEELIRRRIGIHRKSIELGLTGINKLSEELRIKTLKMAPRDVLVLEVKIAVAKSQLAETSDVFRRQWLLHEIEEMQWLLSAIDEAKTHGSIFVQKASC